jgi:hypothetical protein
MSEVKHPIRNPSLEPLTEGGEPIMAPSHDSTKEYFHEVLVDTSQVYAGEVNSRFTVFRHGAARRNSRRENHG